MKFLKLAIIFIATISMFVSCTAINSTYNSLGSSVKTLFGTPRIVENKIKDPYNPDAKLSVLWIGHATTLIQIEDKFILTDPVFTDTEAMFAKRIVEPGIEPEYLPNIDVTLISHLHMDHLSLGTLDMIESKINNLIVPEGGLVYIPNYDFESFELKKWNTFNIDGVEIIATPVVHNGWRYGIDYKWMTKSYAGYIIKYKGVTVYYAGDTGYDPELFIETGIKFEDIDLAILPIAPIHPREYSKIRHTDGKEAIQIYFDVKADYMMPIHYDTFPESYDTLGEAVSLLRGEMLAKNLTDDQIIICEIGEQKIFIKKNDLANK